MQEALIKKAQQKAVEERKLKEGALLKLTQKMKEYGESIAAIQEVTGLTTAEIDKL